MLSNDPATIIHQDRINPLRTPEFDFRCFYTTTGGLIRRENRGVTQSLFEDPRIYGKFQKKIFILRLVCSSVGILTPIFERHIFIL